MKKKLVPIIIFVTAGAIIQPAFAIDAHNKTGAQSHEQSNANASANQMVQLKRASNLIGMDVRNQQDEKLGDIKDVIINLQSGQAPFAVISSGGFFGVGNRLLAIPTTTLAQHARQDEFVLNMDSARLKSAPSFDNNDWPDVNDQAWRSQIYSFYGVQPEAQASMASTTGIEINEAARAQASQYSDRSKNSEYGETSSSADVSRRPRQGLGAKDLTGNGGKLSSGNQSAASTETEINESAGAQPSQYSQNAARSRYSDTEEGIALDKNRRPRQGLGVEDLTYTPKEAANLYDQEYTTGFQESAGAERTEMRHHKKMATSGATAEMSGNTKRASDLIGMEVKNSQGERIGEVKDVVIDLKSGRVAYAALDAGGLLSADNKLYAVPPTMLTHTGDERWLVLNTDKETLKAAPSFDKNNWPQAENQQFTTEVYRYYHQQPYWQSSRRMKESSGAEPNMQHHGDRDSSGWQKGTYNEQQKEQKQIQEPSGAAPATPVPGGELNEPTPQTEPERNADRPLSSQNQNQINGSAAKETAEAQSTPQYQQQSQIQNEAAGASVQNPAPATSEDQAASDSDRRLSQQLRTTLQSDPSLENVASKVKVSTANGRITLRGTVSSQQEKQAIADQAKKITGSEDKVDNQLQVGGQSTNP